MSFLKPLLDNIDIKVNGPLSSNELYYAAICVAVDNSSVHSASKHYQEIPCETSLRYHLKKLDLEELIHVNETILLQGFISTLRPGPIIIDEDMFRILFVEEWLSRKLRIQLVVHCLR
jgi:hypothetical protein